MGIFFKKAEKIKEKKFKPYPQEIEEAMRNPNGWVYRIAGKYSKNEAIPPEAIVGAWQVDFRGNIIGDFQKNKKYHGTRGTGTR